MAALELKLLGGFEGRLRAGAVLELPTRKTRLLLGFLALSPGAAQPRRKLASLLWSDRGDEQALHSLRQALSALRKSLAGIEPAPLVSDREHVSLESGAVEVDAVAFEALIEAGTPEAVAKACALYRGELLDGHDPGDSSCDAWLFYERRRLHDLALRAFERLLAHRQAQSATAQAIETGQQLLRLDPTHEAAHRALMALYAAQGRRAAALDQYKQCRAALARELEVEPEPETEQLHRQILIGRDRRRTSQTISGSRADGAALPIPETPSIAVLPFRNLMAAGGNDRFIDGLTETIITELSRFPDLSVIASNSVFTYKGRAVKVQSVADELGVRHVLEGSVQEADGRMRITAQLIDGITGHHVWAERYEGERADVFALQDEITLKIVGSLATGYGGRLTKAWRDLGRRKGDSSLTAYDCLLRGEAEIETMDQRGVRAGRELFEKAIEIDPAYARAHAKLAFTHILAIADGWAEAPEAAAAQAEALARQAIRLDDSDPWGHWALGTVRFAVFRDYDRGLESYERALEISPNDADVLADHGWVLGLAGRPLDGIKRIRRAVRLNPHYPRWYMTGLGLAYYGAARYAKAIAALDRAPEDNPTRRLYLAASYGQLGREADARRLAESILEAEPDLSLDSLRPRAPYRRAEDFAHLIDGLRKSGLTV